jgi:aminoglycoside phosphotransferase family enzyme
MDNKYLIESFLNGTVRGIEEYGLIPAHVETQISHLFIFPSTVYKFSKRNNTFFNEHFRDLSSREERLNFYKADFFENHYFSPNVYLELCGVYSEANESVLRLGVEQNTEDAVIRMKRINLDCNLSNLLHKKSLSEDEFRTMGYQQTKAVALYPHQPKSSENYFEIFKRRLEDLKQWMLSAENYFSGEEIDRIIEVLNSYVDKRKVAFENIRESDYVVSLDNHSDNVFYENGNMFFLDIYPPKEDWMVVTPWTNIYRPATDIFILMGEKYARAFLAGYKDYYGNFDESYENLYFVYSAAIQGVSLHNLSKESPTKHEDSLAYKKFVLEKITEIK